MEPLSARILETPLPYDVDAAARVRVALAPVLANAPDIVRRLIDGVSGCSPYLGALMRRRPDALSRILSSAPEAFVDAAIEAAWRAAEEFEPAQQSTALRAAKAEAALAIGIAEISGALATMEAAALYTRFADAAAGAALRMALRQLAPKGFAAVDPAAPEAKSGVAIIAMGKMGGFELNYSSDIDLVAVYDPSAPALGGADNAKALAVSAVKLMVARLSDQTADGYVFRTDLRLRPDPGVSSIALSVGAAEAYYEAYGQNWERAAYIKARAAAGDIALGEAFLTRLRPFVWRKYLDYAAIDDILSIKRQIHAAKGGAKIEFEGHDLKTGRGGIREIEFSVQTQQLILGGKDDALRTRSTLEGLDLLAARGVIGPTDAATLAANYRYLRMVEHRIQMTADEQTHKTPRDSEGVARLAAFLGATPEDFREKLTDALRSTHRIFSGLYERKSALSSGAGSLSFTGVDFDADTLASISAMGFGDARGVAETIRRWHTGEIRATRSKRARELLTELTPTILKALAGAARPGEAFLAFDRFLRGLPAGVQIFSLLAHNASVFDTLVRIMTVSPYLGKELARRAHLVEALTESSWPPPSTPRAARSAALAAAISRSANFEDAINAMRRWRAEENFDVAAQLAVGRIDAREAGARFTTLAEVVIEALLPVAITETERLHGRIDGRIMVLGLGRLGASRMTAASDIDLIFIYDASEGVMSDGAKPLDGVTYFTRLVRRFLSGMSMPTEEGVLYEVDMALRPSGGAGPVAVSLHAFRRYYFDDAWTWEKMALVKARPVAGDASLSGEVAAEIATILARPRDTSATARDVDDMRERLIANKRASGPWDIKTVRGGATEIDFIIQHLTLVAAPEGFAARQDQAAALNALFADERLTLTQRDGLCDADELFETVMQIGRAAAGDDIAAGAAGPALAERLAEATGAASVEALEARLAEVERGVRAIYEQILLHAAKPVAGQKPGEHA